MNNLRVYGALTPSALTCGDGTVLRLIGRNRWADESLRLAATFSAGSEIVRKFESRQFDEDHECVIFPATGKPCSGVCLRVEDRDPERGAVNIGVWGLPFHSEMIWTCNEDYALFSALIPDEQQRVAEMWRLAIALWTRVQEPEDILDTPPSLIQIYAPASGAVLDFRLAEIDDGKPFFSMSAVYNQTMWEFVGEAA